MSFNGLGGSRMESTKQRKSVYVIEDDIEMSTIIDRVLKSIDPSIILDWSTSAEEAIQKIQSALKKGVKKPYDLIITDVLLDGSRSGIDFWQFCQNEFSKIPIVVTSACSKDSLFKTSTPLPKSLIFLQKPFSISESKKLFKKLLLEKSNTTQSQNL